MNASLIARSNPYQMGEKEMRSLMVGREKLLSIILEAIKNNLKHPKTPNEHLHLTGQRGIGKSFLLRLLQIELQNSPDVRLVLLPEEQPNIFSPADLLQEISQHLSHDLTNHVASWDAPEQEAWQNGLSKLHVYLDQLPGSPLLIVVIENFDEIIQRHFKDDIAQSQLRRLLEHDPRIMLIVTSLFNDVDTDYNERLFQAFKHVPVPPWNQDQHVEYLKRRAALAKLPFVAEQGYKIRAYSQFTGGSPRIAMVLADLLLGQREAQHVAVNLQTLVDTLTDYYLDLLNRIPSNSRKLFDALVRVGEPCSQTALAERVNATQSRISRAFAWLRDHRYIQEEARIGKSKERLYRVSDRVMVQFYRMRYLHRGKNHSALVSMSDFLADYFSVQEQKEHAKQLMQKGESEPARLFAELALTKGGIDTQQLNAIDTDKVIGFLDIDDTEKLSEKFKSPEELEKASHEAITLLKSCQKYNDFHGVMLAELLEKVTGLSQLNKISTCYYLASEQSSLIQWLYFESAFKGVIFEQKANASQNKHLYQQAITFYQQALEKGEELESKLLMAYCLGRIGWCLQKLERNEEAITTHHAALAQREDQGNFDDKAWNQEQIGLCLQKLERYGEALTSHHAALAQREDQGNFDDKTWNQEQIGWCLQELERFDEALTVHQAALALRKEQGDVDQQAWNQERIGWCLQKLDRYDEALTAHLAAFAVRKEQGNVGGQAWNQGLIGWCLQELERYEEALTAHQAALALRKEQGDVDQEAWNQGRIGWCLQKLERYEEALIAQQMALALRKEQGDFNQQAWNQGQIARIYWTTGDIDRAWLIIESFQPPKDQSDLRYIPFKQLGCAIIDVTKESGRAAGFQQGLQLLRGLNNRKQYFDAEPALRLMIIGFLAMKQNVELVRDLCTEALSLFGDQVATIVMVTEITLDYIASGKDPVMLQRLNPDLATTVRTLASIV